MLFYLYFMTSWGSWVKNKQFHFMSGENWSQERLSVLLYDKLSSKEQSQD